MKNIFSWKRFAMVLQKDAADLRLPFLKTVLILGGIWVLAFLFAKYVIPIQERDFQTFRLFLLVAFIGGSLLLSPFHLYKNHNHRLKGINYFMLPASQLEKFCSMLFYCVVVTPVVAVITFALLDICTYVVYSWFGQIQWQFQWPLMDFKSFYAIIKATFVLQSVFILCTVLFRKAKIQKTALTMGIAMVVLGVFLSFLDTFFPTGNDELIKLFSDQKDKFILIIDSIREATQQTVWAAIKPYLLWLIVPLGFWVVSFMKLKEQEL
jgi:hypothetical protein